MVSKLISATVIGLDAQLVHVEVHFSIGKSKFFIVGLPDKACSESKERVAAVIRHFLGRRIPAGTITVNLAPADILKAGPVYDLPIALGILLVLRKLSFDPRGKLFIGELSLDGKARHTNAILPIADLAASKQINELFIPSTNAKEASLIPGIKVFPVKNLTELVDFLQGRGDIAPMERSYLGQNDLSSCDAEPFCDFSLIKGQEHAKRALEIAAAGGHNLLMTGSPGSGKTLLARALPSILPSMTLPESLEVTRIYSVTGMIKKDTGLIMSRPFRKPHHTVSHVALVGGGTIPRPGEISLAHRGVLFLDEFSEFSNQALESLRQPLEDGTITISRAKGTLTFPAKVMLISAMNPCKCGWLNDPHRECICTPSEITRFSKKISGPVLDRIDMQIFVPRLEFEKLASDKPLESSSKIQSRVQKARDLQLARYNGGAIISNSEMTPKEIKELAKLEKPSSEILRRAMEAFHLSARSYFRLIKVARTIADLEGKESIHPDHVREALSFRIEVEE